MPTSYSVDAYRQEMWQIHDFQEEMTKSMRYFLMKKAKRSAKSNKEGISNSYFMIF